MNMTVTEHLSPEPSQQDNNDSFNGSMRKQKFLATQNQQRQHIRKKPQFLEQSDLEMIENKIDQVIGAHQNVDRFSPIKKDQEGSCDQTFDDDVDAMEQRMAPHSMTGNYNGKINKNV